MIDPYLVLDQLEDLPSCVFYPVKLSTYGKQKPIIVSTEEWTGILLFPERITKNMGGIMRRNWNAGLPTFGVVESGAVLQLWYDGRHVHSVNRTEFGALPMFTRNLIGHLKLATEVDRDDWIASASSLQGSGDDEGWI
jgi:hypothetical protein